MPSSPATPWSRVSLALRFLVSLLAIFVASAMQSLVPMDLAFVVLAALVSAVFCGLMGRKRLSLVILAAIAYHVYQEFPLTPRLLPPERVEGRSHYFHVPEGSLHVDPILRIQAVATHYDSILVSLHMVRNHEIEQVAEFDKSSACGCQGGIPEYRPVEHSVSLSTHNHLEGTKLSLHYYGFGPGGASVGWAEWSDDARNTWKSEEAPGFDQERIMYVRGDLPAKVHQGMTLEAFARKNYGTHAVVMVKLNKGRRQSR